MVGVLLEGIDLTAHSGVTGYTDRVLFNSGSTGGVGRDVLWHKVLMMSNPLPLPEPACPADVDGSGTIDVLDVRGLLGMWGACGESCFCLSDVDDDGLIGIDDMLGVLAQWAADCGP